MSYTISTYVFCDGPSSGLDTSRCRTWVYGSVGARARKSEAWEHAADDGWKRINGRHYCPHCAKQLGL